MKKIFTRIGLYFLFFWFARDCAMETEDVTISSTLVLDRIPLQVSEEPSLIVEQDFLKGVAISSFQAGGHPQTLKMERQSSVQSNWSEWEKTTVNFTAKNIGLTAKPAIAGGQKIGISADFYNHAFEDIKLLKLLGCNSLRFSVEWADVEPREGVFNEKVLSFYREFCEALKENGIVPMVTLYHFVLPQWFVQKGGFEKRENIDLFVRYSKKVFENLADLVPLWCTINEPGAVSACGYVLAIHPPGKLFSFELAATVLINLLNAHVTLYYELKKMPQGKNVKIGLAHNPLIFESYKYTLSLPLPYFKETQFSDPLSPLMSKYMTRIFAHDITLAFFKTGKFEYPLPFGSKVIGTNNRAPNSFDFWGLNFYSRVTVAGVWTTHYPGQIMTDTHYAIQPERFYDAIVDAATLGKPIYITENGAAVGDDTKRSYFIRSYVQEMYRAKQEGYNIPGYYYWTLTDNFEWHEGFGKQFGLFSVNFNNPLRPRTMRNSALTFRDVIKIKEKTPDEKSGSFINSSSNQSL